MTTEHKWHIVIPTLSANDCKIYLDDEKFELPVTRINVDIVAGEPVRITAEVIPRGLDALLTFSEENPLVVNVCWPIQRCPHCGEFHSGGSMLAIPPVEERQPEARPLRESHDEQLLLWLVTCKVCGSNRWEFWWTDEETLNARCSACKGDLYLGKIKDTNKHVATN